MVHPEFAGLLTYLETDRLVGQSGMTSLPYVIVPPPASHGGLSMKVSGYQRAGREGKLQYVSTYFFQLIDLFLAVLGLCCCVQAFSSCGKWDILFVVVCRFLIAVASLVMEHRVEGTRASVVAACGLSSVVVAQRLSCSTACGILVL